MIPPLPEPILNYMCASSITTSPYNFSTDKRPTKNT